MSELDIHLGKRLRRRRRLLGLTQKDLADAIGIRFQQIQKYECAGNKMSASRLWQLAEAMHVPVSYFYEGFKEPGQEESLQELLPAELLRRPETLDLLQSFYCLGEVQRRKFLELIKSLDTKTNIVDEVLTKLAA